MCRSHVYYCAIINTVCIYIYCLLLIARMRTLGTRIGFRASAFSKEYKPSVNAVGSRSNGYSTQEGQYQGQQNRYIISYLIQIGYNHTKYYIDVRVVPHSPTYEVSGLPQAFLLLFTIYRFAQRFVL